MKGRSAGMYSVWRYAQTSTHELPFLRPTSTVMYLGQDKVQGEKGYHSFPTRYHLNHLTPYLNSPASSSIRIPSILHDPLCRGIFGTARQIRVATGQRLASDLQIPTDKSWLVMPSTLVTSSDQWHAEWPSQIPWAKRTSKPSESKNVPLCTFVDWR